MSATFASVYQVFSHFDRLQSRANRHLVSRWLLGLSVPSIEWSWFFYAFFEKVFGDKQLSVRCISRSIMLTLFLMALALMAMNFTLPVFKELPIDLSVKFVAVATLSAIVIDYINLWETRIILTKIPGIRTSWASIAIVGLDILITSVVFWIFFAITSAVFLRGFYFQEATGRNAPVHSPYSEIGFMLIIVPLFPEFLIALMKEGLPVLLYMVSLFTSAWIWAYIVGAQALRLFILIPPFLRALSKIADLREHPICTLGFMAALISSGLVGLISVI